MLSMEPKRITLLAIFIFCLMISGSALAQLTAEEIDSLQQTARVEGWTFEVGENPATQFSLDELCGMVEPQDWRATAKFDSTLGQSDAELPSHFDWRELNGTTPIRNQGGCGSCWAFGTVGALECNIKIVEGIDVNLSEQWLVSCNRNGWGCDGGWFAHDYHEWKKGYDDSTGAVLEENYPYTASDAGCSYPDPHPYLIEDWAYIGNSSSIPSIAAMKQAIMEYGPISVCVLADNAMMAYRGGVFSTNSYGSINHAVVLVGWDDTQGTAGVWFMRNSWGTGWGEAGYMRIEYGSNMIGYAACYVDYKPINVSVDNDFGPVPLAVNFAADAPATPVDSCLWQFGDGGESTMMSCSHDFDQPGNFDVQLTIFSPDGNRVKNMPGLISVYADSMAAEFSLLKSNMTVRVDARVHNYLPLTEITVPLEWEGPLALRYDSMSTAGLRTNYFAVQSLMNLDRTHSRLTAVMRSDANGTGDALDPGDGPVVSFYFSNPHYMSTESNPVTMDGYYSFLPEFKSYYDVYTPEIIPGNVATPGCCQGVTGNVDADPDEVIDIGDLTKLIDYLFISYREPYCLEEANTDGTGAIDIGDLTALIDYLFIGYNPTAACP